MPVQPPALCAFIIFGPVLPAVYTCLYIVQHCQSRWESQAGASDDGAAWRPTWVGRVGYGNATRATYKSSAGTEWRACTSLDKCHTASSDQLVCVVGHCWKLKNVYVHMSRESQAVKVTSWRETFEWISVRVTSIDWKQIVRRRCGLPCISSKGAAGGHDKKIPAPAQRRVKTSKNTPTRHRQPTKSQWQCSLVIVLCCHKTKQTIEWQIHQKWESIQRSSRILVQY